MPESFEPTARHFTTRRSFAVLMGLLVLALYFIWAAYGAAPTSFQFLSETQNEGMESMEGGGHGAAGMPPEKFAELTEHFIEEFSLPDGSVKPTRADHGHRTARLGDKDHGTNEHANPEPMADMAAIMIAAAAVGAGAEEKGHADPDHEAAEPIDVYLMASRYSYTPQILRIEQGVPYRFRMMSMDVNHGASIHTGFAGHIMRRPARALVEMVMTFTKPGEYMIYCTVYCGEGHDLMKGKIIVE